MPDIRYVCFSDTHFGADNSLLTNLGPGSVHADPTTPSPVLTRLVACLRALIATSESPTKPTLILNGDILELALTTDNIAAMAFERFIELILPASGESLFDKTILYIPGNHDHHLWETARETQYVNFISRQPWGGVLEIPWHTTKMCAPDAVPATLMNGLLRRYPHANGTVVGTVYPNFGLVSADGERCVVFSHGHFTESIYMLMTNLKNLLFPGRTAPGPTWDLEAENFAWIDFYWSMLGRSGDIGHDIDLLYDKFTNEAQVKQIAARLATRLAHRYAAWWLAPLARPLLKIVLERTLGEVGNMERGNPSAALTADGAAGLRAYLEGPLRQQILTEHDQIMPPHVTFVFGHTHKPFEADMQFRGYPGWTSVYNSGGWVVDSVEPQPVAGAAAILVDENLNAVSLRLYNEAVDASSYAVRVASATPAGAEANPFYQRIRSLVDASTHPWRAFSGTVAGAVPLYARNLASEIKRKL